MAHLRNFYIILGIAVAMSIEHPAGVITSMLMAATGLFIFNIRLAHRKMIIATPIRKHNYHA